MRGVLDAAGLVIGAAHVEGQAVFVDEHMAEHRVHGLAGVCHGGFEVHARGGGFLAGLEQRSDPALGVVQRLVDIGIAFHGFAAARHDRIRHSGRAGLPAWQATLRSWASPV
jgi:hypothetical protein